ncbi:MAG: EAL domain-containing protein [Deltaproteobacteria bacterium]|nr:EAL domain-containing protein [Deltaproteobacteria bacterium]
MINSANNIYCTGEKRPVRKFTRFLSTVFQPIYSAEYMEVYGFEALTKIENSDMCISKLFSIALESREILFLDMYCRQMAMKNASLSGFRNQHYLFLNICPEVLLDTAHKPQVTDYLAAKYNISKDHIILEITEESAVRDYKTFLKAIEYYRTNGYKIAIDDFGVGFGGPKMLSEVKPEIVKIDRYFIMTAIRNRISKNFIKLIVELCNETNILVLAEGIESQDELELMTRLKVDLLQGYFLGRPSPKLPI